MGERNKTEAFEYPASAEGRQPPWEGWAAALIHEEPEGEPHPAAAMQPRERSPDAPFERQWTEERQRWIEEGREAGLQEGRQLEREAQLAAAAAREQRRQQQAAGLLESFARARESYFAAVEGEVVRLALAVAARVLRREAQMDPLLLTGAVRVALGQLAGTTEVRLLVPEADLEMWREAVRLLPNLALKPAVEAGAGMQLGECRVETAIGSVDLGMQAQMGEIERGLLDRAGGRTAESAAGSGDFLHGVAS